MEKKRILILVLVLGCLGWGCSQNRVQGTSSEKAEARRIKTEGIRVMAYNIHHANPPSKEGLIDIESIAKVINEAKADLVALQEVDVYTERSGKTLHQAEAIARLTGMQYYFGKAIDYGGGEYGVAILSKFAITNTKTQALPTEAGTKGEPRVLATAEVSLPGNKKIIFASTHLDAQRNETNRLLQIKKIGELLAKETLPVIIGGDFNADPSRETITIMDSFLKRTCITDCGFTIPVVRPTKTIDYIAYMPASAFTVKEHTIIQEHYASDHLPVFSVLIPR